jgi:hypothetical protein
MGKVNAANRPRITALTSFTNVVAGPAPAPKLVESTPVKAARRQRRRTGATTAR